MAAQQPSPAQAHCRQSACCQGGLKAQEDNARRQHGGQVPLVKCRTALVLPVGQQITCTARRQGPRIKSSSRGSAP